MTKYDRHGADFQEIRASSTSYKISLTCNFMKIHKNISSLITGDRVRTEGQTGEVYISRVPFEIGEENLKIFALYYWPALVLQVRRNSIVKQSRGDAGGIKRREERGSTCGSQM